MTKSLVLSVLAILVVGFMGCGPSEPGVNVNISVADKAPSASEGFNLEQFHKLLIEEGDNEAQWDAQFLSDLVNREDINNLDLNQNGIVDTILIEPFDGGDSKGFQLYTKVMDYEGMDKDEEQTICTVVVEKKGDKGDLTVSGNQQMYGQNHHYQSSNLSTFFLMYWMMSPRFGGFGGGYNSYPPRSQMSSSRYNQTMANRNANHTGTTAPKADRPNNVKQAATQQKTAAKGVKSKLASPTSSQRSFRSQTQAKSNSSSGFGKKSTGTKGSSSSGRSGGRSSGGK
jgi:uncharacterized membrane protein YgcG